MAVTVVVVVVVVGVRTDHVFERTGRADCQLLPSPNMWTTVQGKYAVGSDQVLPYFAFRITEITPGRKYLTVGVRLTAQGEQPDWYFGDGSVFGVCAEDPYPTGTLVRRLARTADSSTYHQCSERRNRY